MRLWSCQAQIRVSAVGHWVRMEPNCSESVMVFIDGILSEETVKCHMEQVGQTDVYREHLTQTHMDAHTHTYTHLTHQTHLCTLYTHFHPQELKRCYPSLPLSYSWASPGEVRVKWGSRKCRDTLNMPQGVFTLVQTHGVHNACLYVGERDCLCECPYERECVYVCACMCVCERQRECVRVCLCVQRWMGLFIPQFRA